MRAELIARSRAVVIVVNISVEYLNVGLRLIRLQFNLRTGHIFLFVAIVAIESLFRITQIAPKQRECTDKDINV